MSEFMRKLEEYMSTRGGVRSNVTTTKTSQVKSEKDFVLSSLDMGVYGTELNSNESIQNFIRVCLDDTKPTILDVSVFLHVVNAAEEVLKASPSISFIRDSNVVVVGDLHGSLVDLQRIFDKTGWPGETLQSCSYIFNGDFVDRGTKGCEVLAVLLAMKILYPKQIFLNRGNHEDPVVCRAYGFYEELMAKYGSQHLYDRVTALFRWLPLCAIIDKRALVVHAGPPCLDDITLAHIGALSRGSLSSTTVVSYSSLSSSLSEERLRSLQVIENMMWSDPIHPITNPGSEHMIVPNTSRKAGMKYGVGVVADVLKKLNLPAMIRSHQSVYNGFEEIDCDGVRRLYTVFSASNYQDSGYKGSILVYDSIIATIPPKLIQFDPLEVEGASLVNKFKKKFVDLICANLPELIRAMDRESSMSLIQRDSWAKVMQNVLKLEVDFINLVPMLAADAASGDGRFINVHLFAKLYHVDIVCPNGNKIPLTTQGASQFMKNKNFLLAMFRFMDSYKYGSLTREEIKCVSKLLDETRSAEFDHIFDVIELKNDSKFTLADIIESWGFTHSTSSR
jgi:diadenosine tetraphosphatase ApaH/serine/threonine PP2A family protein phosphatase